MFNIQYEDLMMLRFYNTKLWIFGGAKVIISTQRVGINKGVINPLSEAEKQGLAPQDIVPPKLVSKTTSENQVGSLRYKNRGPKTPETLKY
jgi:hypothetical protein